MGGITIGITSHKNLFPSTLSQNLMAKLSKTFSAMNVIRVLFQSPDFGV